MKIVVTAIIEEGGRPIRAYKTFTAVNLVGLPRKGELFNVGGNVTVEIDEVIWQDDLSLQVLLKPLKVGPSMSSSILAGRGFEIR